jgi:hypothetical protein
MIGWQKHSTKADSATKVQALKDRAGFILAWIQAIEIVTEDVRTQIELISLKSLVKYRAIGKLKSERKLKR